MDFWKKLAAFISGDKRILLKAASLWNKSSGLLLSKDWNSKILGYPSCCIKSFQQWRTAADNGRRFLDVVHLIAKKQKE